MPCHHTLEGDLVEYLERARLADAGRVPLFQAFKHRPYRRGQAELRGERLDRINAWKMEQPACQRKSATTPSAALALPLTWRTVARWRRPVRWRRTPPPAPRNSTIDARTV